MLDQELQQAKAVRTKQHKQLMLMLLAVAVCLLFAWGLYFWWQETSSTTQIAAGEQELPVQVQPELTVSQLEKLREEYQKLNQVFEQQIKPQLTKLSEGQWAKSALLAIADSKQQALSLFAQGQYQQALVVTKQMITDARGLIAKWHSEFTRHFTEAEQAFVNDLADDARTALNKALAIKPNEHQALSLQKRLQVLSGVLALLDDLKVARLENNLHRQLSVLNDILALDPERTLLAQQRDQVSEQIRQQQLSEAIESGLAAVAAQDLPKARQWLSDAKKVGAREEETRYLASEIAKLSVSQAQQKDFQQLNQVIEQDNWQLLVAKARIFVKSYRQKAGARQAAISQVQEWLDTGEQLLVVNKEVKGLLASPDRLNDDRVREHARQLIEEHGALTLNSMKFTEDMLALEQLIEDASTEVSVTIESDGQTYIVLIGHGNVGTTHNRSIKLRPGNYIFEGRRQGFRSVRVTLNVASDSQELGVKVVCNERI